MTIKQSVINTFKRIGIDPMGAQDALNSKEKITVTNRFGGGSCETNLLIAILIKWVYGISDAYEAGDQTVKVSDFDRVRYFILEVDPEAYNTCID